MILQRLQDTVFFTVYDWQCDLQICGVPGGSMTRRGSDRLIRRGGSVISMNLDSLMTVAEKSTLDNLLHILDDVSHLLHTVISNWRGFSDGLALLTCKTTTQKHTFVPLAIKLFNSEGEGEIEGHRRMRRSSIVQQDIDKIKKLFLLFVIFMFL